MKNKISFVLYGDNEWILSENQNYINSLNLPNDTNIEVFRIMNKGSLASCLEFGRKQSDAKYKIYLDQNAYIIDKNFIFKIISTFEKHPKLGILGVRGYYLDTEKNEMKFLGNNLYHQYGYNSKISILKEGEATGVIAALALDKHVMITTVDTPWADDDSNTNIVKSVELRHMGFETAVLIDDNPMVLFDNSIL